MTRDQALRALARLVVICGAKRYGMHCRLSPVVDEAAQVQGAGRQRAAMLEAETFPGESGRSDPYRLMRALVILDRQDKAAAAAGKGTRC